MKFKEKPLDLDKVLGKTRNQIYRVGIELEGGWTKLPNGTVPGHDGSVVVEAPADTEFDTAYQKWSLAYRRARDRGEYYSVPEPKRTWLTGEIPSPPIEVEKVEPWMRQFYPQVVNNTCGMHVHFSFKTALQYQRLMTPAYPATIIEYFTLWAKKEGLAATHPLWDRLAGKNRFCKHEFHADQQVSSKKDHSQTRPGHRYTVVNYCYSVYQGTMECRLLPMMETPDQGIRAVKYLLDITNAFLVTYRAREERASSKVEADKPVREHKQTTLYPERRGNVETY